MIRNVVILFFIYGMLLTSCTSSGEQQASGSKAAAKAKPPGAFPELSYSPPSLDRTEKGDPEGSPFMPELLQEVFPLDAGEGLNRNSAANGRPKLSDEQFGTQTRMVYKDLNNNREIALIITDSGILALTMDHIVPWLKTPMNSETENTIQRTGAFKGFPFYERYLKKKQEGELHILVNKRFEVVAIGKGVSHEVLWKVVEEWDLSSLY